MAEEIAEKYIRRAGYRVYLPRTRKILTGHRPGRGEIVMRPLFPRYLFAALDPAQQWSPILRSIGVADLIWRAQSPALLPGELIDELRERERAEEFDEPRRAERARRSLEPGNVVRITQGAFSGQLAILRNASGNKRVEVLLQMIARVVSVERDKLELVAS